MYVPTLLESKRRANKGKLLGVGFASLTIHTAVIAGVVYATLHASRPDNTVKMDTTVVLLAPQHEQKPPEQQPAQLDIPLKGCQTVAVVREVPTTLPPPEPTPRPRRAHDAVGAQGHVPSRAAARSRRALVRQPPVRLFAGIVSPG